MNNNELLQYFQSQTIDIQNQILKDISSEQLKGLLFDLKKEAREKAFNLLNPESQTQFMQSLSLSEKKELLNSSTYRGLTIAFNALEDSGRKNHLDTLSNIERNRFIKVLRVEAVDLFWNKEQDLIKQGFGTREWMVEQMEMILNIGMNGYKIKVGGAAFEYVVDGDTVLNIKGNGEVYLCHHMLCVEAFPQYAGDPRSLQTLTVSEHKCSHNI